MFLHCDRDKIKPLGMRRVALVFCRKQIWISGTVLKPCSRGLGSRKAWVHRQNGQKRDVLGPAAGLSSTRFWRSGVSAAIAHAANVWTVWHDESGSRCSRIYHNFTSRVPASLLFYGEDDICWRDQAWFEHPTPSKPSECPFPARSGRAAKELLLTSARPVSRSHGHGSMGRCSWP